MLVKTSKKNVYVNTDHICKLWIENPSDCYYKVMASLGNSTVVCLDHFTVKEAAVRYQQQLVKKHNMF